MGDPESESETMGSLVLRDEHHEHYSEFTNVKNEPGLCLWAHFCAIRLPPKTDSSDCQSKAKLKSTSSVWFRFLPSRLASPLPRRTMLFVGLVSRDFLFVP